jgi:uncharacterized protein YdiU (UPF0061 family)
VNENNSPREVPLKQLGDLDFDDSFVRALPADPLPGNEPREVLHACYTRVDPTPVRAPQLLAWSDALGRTLGIAPPGSPTGLEAEVLGGNRVLPGMKPYAARYGGHQFGQWAGQLGDGRAITLAELRDRDGRRQELQLKGAGLTPYSRFADGRAVLRSSLREFLCSEAMHHLGVPTTRALSLVGTGETVVRDMFYDGRPAHEPGAVVCRVAPSFVRFGSFEILAASDEPSELQRLADYVILEHYPELGPPSPAIYARWFEEICRRTAVMIADWMRVGFVHGVMNTDNMSILGLTIDYGPYGWLEGYDPGWTPNTTDNNRRRYCYGRQPEIALWNLARLAESLLPLVGDRAALQRGLEAYGETFNQAWGDQLAAKVGLRSLGETGDDQLVSDLFDALQEDETDMTIFFRRLAEIPLETAGASDADDVLVEPLRPAFYGRAPRVRLAAWLRRYVARARQEGVSATERRERMNRVNPKYVLRNYLAQQAIDALERGDGSVMGRIMKVLERPYDDQPGNDDLAERRPEWARNKPGCSALSCSS